MANRLVPDGRLLLTVEEAARACGYSRSFLYEAMNRGEIPVIRLGRTVRISRAWLEQWVVRKVEAWEKANGMTNEEYDSRSLSGKY